MRGSINDRDYEILIAIARTFYFLKGEFCPRDIYNLIAEHKFGIRKPMNTKSIGVILARSSLFEKTRTQSHRVYYKVVE